MNDIDYLKRAIELTHKSSEPVPCACIIVKDNNIIGEAYNSQRTDESTINHAEIKAIRLANQATGERKLNGAIAYCSCEPCAMCLTALALAGMAKIVYDQPLKDLSPEDPLARFDSQTFLRKYFPRAPKLEHLVVS